MHSMAERTAADWVRWGDSETVGWDAATGAAFTVKTSQLCDVVYDRPTTWTSRVVVNLQMPAGETATGVVRVQKTFGVGSSTCTLESEHAFAPPYADVIDDDVFPASTIQVKVFLDVTSAIAGVHRAICSAFVAPRFHEAHVYRVLPNDAGVRP